MQETMEPPPDEADEQGAAIGGNTTRGAVETGFIESDAGLLVGTTAAFPTSGMGARLIGTESNRADPSSNTSGPGHDNFHSFAEENCSALSLPTARPFWTISANM